MFRVANVVVVLALLVTAAAVYQLKYASTAEAERLASLRQSIRKERDAIAVMRAEWARRTSPLYIQGLVQRHLDLMPLDVDSISTLADLPEKPAGNNDGIGGMIEVLVDAPLATSSTGRTAPAPAAGGASAPVSSTAPASSALRPQASAKPASPVSASPTQGARSAPAARSAPVPPPAAPAEADGLAPLLPPGAVPGAAR